DGGLVRGPGFEAWDLKFGHIVGADAEWTERDIEDGADQMRVCKVDQQPVTLLFPMPGEPVYPSYGLTFEYKTTKPDVRFTIEIIFPPGDGGGSETSREEGRLVLPQKGQAEVPGKKRGRFCFEGLLNTPYATRPGRYCYKVSVEGVALKSFCLDLVNRDGKGERLHRAAAPPHAPRPASDGPELGP
ncbi:MAG TPA: hypothetical protein VGI29_12420, partial [Candidatus Binataceae bacterium]